MNVTKMDTNRSFSSDPHTHNPHKVNGIKNFGHRLAERSQNPHRIFLFLALVFGGLFLILTPPFQEPDGYAHFLRIYSISAGKVIPLNLTFPRSLIDFQKNVSPDPLPGNMFNKQSKQALLEQFITPFDDETPVAEIDITNTIEYSHVAYTPQVIGVSLGRMLHLPAIFMFYLARICNFAVWVLGVYWAIKLTPVFKWVFFLLALLPMTVFQGASISPDALLIAGCFLFIAICLQLAIRKEKPVFPLNVIALSGLLLLISFMKPGYILIWAFAWVIPVKKFGTFWRKIGIMGILLVAALLPTLVWQMVTTNVGIWSGENTSISQNLAFILQSPVKYSAELIQSQIHIFPWTKKMFIGVLGWLDTQLPDYIYTMYTIALVLVPLLDNEDTVRVNPPMRLLGLAFLLGWSAMLSTAFFLSLNPPGGMRFHIIQGRYFIPFSPVYFLFLYQRKVLIPRKWLWLTAVVSAYGLGAAIRALLFRYYAI